MQGRIQNRLAGGSHAHWQRGLVCTAARAVHGLGAPAAASPLGDIARQQGAAAQQTQQQQRRQQRHQQQPRRPRVACAASASAAGGGGGEAGAAASPLRGALAAAGAFVQAQFLPVALVTAICTGCLYPDAGVTVSRVPNLSALVTTAMFVISGLQLKQGEARQALRSAGEPRGG